MYRCAPSPARGTSWLPCHCCGPRDNFARTGRKKSTAAGPKSAVCQGRGISCALFKGKGLCADCHRSSSDLPPMKRLCPAWCGAGAGAFMSGYTPAAGMPLDHVSVAATHVIIYSLYRLPSPGTTHIGLSAYWAAGCGLMPEADTSALISFLCSRTDCTCERSVLGSKWAGCRLPMQPTL